VRVLNREKALKRLKRERKTTAMEIKKISEEQLEQVAGGLYGGGAGQWGSAMVKAAAGVCSFSKSGGAFVRSNQFTIPAGEYITVDLGRRSGNYIIAFYNDQEAWVDSRGLEFI
jgi:hypothetical protein